MAGSLRDQLTDNLETLVQEEAETPGQATTGADATPGAAETTSAEPSKPGRTAGRARDESGKLLPGKAVRPETPAAAGTAPSTTQLAQGAQAAPAAEPTKVQRPSTWKKDHWEAFDKLAQENPALAAYINQREGEFAKGVSTYKGEFDAAKPVLDALAPFKPYLEQHGIEPAQWVNNLGTAHWKLVYGNPQERLSMFAQLARDYKVPLEQMFVRDQQGQIFLNQQLLQAVQQPQQQPQDVAALVRNEMQDHFTKQEVAKFSAENPHFAQVRETMVGLLQSGLAGDLKSAYDAAVRLPQHAEIWDAMQKQRAEQDTTQKAEAARNAAKAARQNSVSPKTSTPTGQVGASTAKGLRAQLEANADELLGGRV